MLRILEEILNITYKINAPSEGTWMLVSQCSTSAAAAASAALQEAEDRSQTAG